MFALALSWSLSIALTTASLSWGSFPPEYTRTKERLQGAGSTCRPLPNGGARRRPRTAVQAGESVAPVVNPHQRPDGPHDSRGGWPRGRIIRVCPPSVRPCCALPHGPSVTPRIGPVWV